MRQLEGENTRLKRPVADLTLDKHCWPRRCEKQSEVPGAGRVVSERLWGQLRAGLSVGQFSRAAWYRPSRARDQSALRLRIREQHLAGRGATPWCKIVELGIRTPFRWEHGGVW